MSTSVARNFPLPVTSSSSTTTMNVPSLPLPLVSSASGESSPTRTSSNSNNSSSCALLLQQQEQAKSLAREAVHWYFSHVDLFVSHQDNVKHVLRGAVIALSSSILNPENNKSNNKKEGNNKSYNDIQDNIHNTNNSNNTNISNGILQQHNGVLSSPPSSPTKDPRVRADASAAGWRAYLARVSQVNDQNINNTSSSTPHRSLIAAAAADQAYLDEAYESLSRRSKARLEAFLASVSLSVPEPTETQTEAQKQQQPQQQQQQPKSQPTTQTPALARQNGSSISSKAGTNGKKFNKEAFTKKPLARNPSLESTGSLSLMEGLAGFRPTVAEGTKNLLRGISAGSKSANGTHKQRKCPQMLHEDLLTRMELYIRSLYKVLSEKGECVVFSESPRMLKARAQCLVTAFVETVGTVRQQGPVLTTLLICLTKELLAVDVLGEDLFKMIRRMVSEYEHKTSFASLAFLSTPDDAADQRLTPMILSYLKYLQHNWENCVSQCELERVLSLTLDSEMRRTFKTIEFRSIGHLLEVCQGFRSELQRIELAPGIGATGNNHVELCNNIDAVRQAVRDLQREVITVNGHVLPPVTSRKDLIHLLSQTLNSRSLVASAPVAPAARVATRRRAKQPIPLRTPNTRSTSDSFSRDTTTTSESECISESDDLLSETDAELSSQKGKGGPPAIPKPRRVRRRSTFHLSTVDFLTRRLLLAAARTGTGGDAYFFVRDLFGGEDVEVVPSHSLPMHDRALRPGTIEIIVKLASIMIKCHASFDVYPKSLVGECEPLIQIHTTTTELIALQEVRAVDSSDEDRAHKPQEDDSDHNDDTDRPRPVMVLQERTTDRTGWRTLSIRPALYEKVEVWNTPS